jgi:hypothetical protein
MQISHTLILRLGDRHVTDPEFSLPTASQDRTLLMMPPDAGEDALVSPGSRPCLPLPDTVSDGVPSAMGW